jgi:hypothetical protein
MSFIIMLLLVFPCFQTTSIARLYRLSNVNWICLFWFIRTEQTVRTAEPRSSDTEFENSEGGPELEEVATKVDDGINGESQDETGRSEDKDTNPGPSGRQLRNLRNSKMVSYREKHSAKA